MRKFLADTFALAVFSTLAGMFVEVIIAGLTLAQSIQVRIAAVPVTLITARPYGLFRDWVFSASGADEGRPVRRTLADMGAFVGFQLPIYTTILLLAGADLMQIVKACGTTTVILAISGRPYGLFLDFARRLFGVKGAGVAAHIANSN